MSVRTMTSMTKRLAVQEQSSSDSDGGSSDQDQPGEKDSGYSEEDTAGAQPTIEREEMLPAVAASYRNILKQVN